MKKVIVVVLVFLALAGCTITPGAGGDPAPQSTAPETESDIITTAPAAETAAPETTTAAATTANRVQQGSGTVGDYNITIKSMHRATDDDGNACVYVDFEWTNNSSETTTFLRVFDDKAYQNGIECDAAYMYDSTVYDSELVWKNIRPGATQTAQRAYALYDTESPVEIEIKEFMNFKSGAPSVSKTFSLK